MCSVPAYYPGYFPLPLNSHFPGTTSLKSCTIPLVQFVPMEDPYPGSGRPATPCSVTEPTVKQVLEQFQRAGDIKEMMSIFKIARVSSGEKAEEGIYV